jgi:hypothetical protein
MLPLFMQRHSFGLSLKFQYARDKQQKFTGPAWCNDRHGITWLPSAKSRILEPKFTGIYNRALKGLESAFFYKICSTALR